MSALGRVRAWMRSVMFRGRAEREMHEEMVAHIEQATERYEARGMSKRDALQAAQVEFGNAAAIQEYSRDSRGGRWVEQTLSDMKYAFRYFLRTPLTTITIILTLTLGVGINTAAFALYEGMNLRPPPGVPDDPSLVVVQGMQRVENPAERFQSMQDRDVSWRELSAYRDDSMFTDIAAWSKSDGVLNGSSENGGSSRAAITFVTPNYFNTIGVQLEAGAGFLSKEFGDINRVELTAVLDFRMAVEQFGTPISAIGKHITVNDQVLTVVGVTAPRFHGIPARIAKNSLWVPLSAMRAMRPRSESFAINDSGYFNVAARLRPGISVAVASARAHTIAMRFTSKEAVWNGFQNMGAEVVRARGLLGVKSDRQSSDELMGGLAIGLLDLIILLVCTTTVSSLLIGAAVARRHEIGVRLALGASRFRIIRQLLAESTLLALAGGIGGLLVFTTVCRTVGAQIMEIDVNPSWSTALFTTAFAMITAILCGLSPALHATRLGLSNTIKESGNNSTSRSRLQRTFVVAQISLAQPLLMCLAMFTVFIVREYSRFKTDVTLEDKLIVARFDTQSAGEAGIATNSIDEVRQRLEGLSGVAGITFSGEGIWLATIDLPKGSATDEETRRARSIEIESRTVAPNYFALMDLPIIAGRVPQSQSLDEPVDPVTVSADFARAVFPGTNPIGREYCISSCEKNAGRYRIEAVVQGEIVGTKTSIAMRVFTPMGKNQYSALLIRTDGPARLLAPAIQSIAKATAPKLPLSSLETVGETNRKNVTEMMQISAGIAGGGLITLLLACVGLYAVVSLAVGQRQREIGIRIALGAEPRTVVRMFFSNGLRLSLIGLGIGLPLSAAIIRILATQVGFPPTNTVFITAAIALIVVVVAALATWIPARRAAGVDPLDALRTQ